MSWDQAKRREVLVLIERLIAYRDGLPRSDRGNRDLLADACNELSNFAEALRPITDGGPE